MILATLDTINAHPLIAALVLLTVFAAVVQGWLIWHGAGSHISVYKRRWVRRIMIFVTLPQELVRAQWQILKWAWMWWRAP